MIPRRPPLLDELNEAFWTGGAAGELRILRCGACGFYLHPPYPQCPVCGSKQVAPSAVSGLGKVHSYTENVHAWVEGATPYTIALVDLPEQEGLRVLSNLRAPDPSDITIGAPVRVYFEQLTDEVWLPLFEVET
ncbi:hypothetical protein GCM10009836_34400 [Pseudonocardia ailaonensis]|uniref:DNA-binding protein n=1 Tax=Pseudonocardia ailaonensis TaxID=367279 RepID=A0ABN2N5M8_9PSEU